MWVVVKGNRVCVARFVEVLVFLKFFLFSLNCLT